MNNGMAGGIGGILMIVLLAAAAMFAWRMLRAKSTGETLQYAGAYPVPDPARSATGGMPQIGSAINGGTPGPAPAVSDRFPPGFDAEPFVRHAKTNFARLQQANDKRDVSTMRDYMTPALYSEIVAQIDPMGVAQITEIVSLEADVVEVVTENNRHIASVRFTGSLRDKASSEAESFDEIWHLEKPLDGSSGWLISGIQQV
jgi:predicted lipid-binding transport protein (Tim44 family)